MASVTTPANGETKTSVAVLTPAKYCQSLRKHLEDEGVYDSSLAVTRVSGEEGLVALPVSGPDEVLGRLDLDVVYPGTRLGHCVDLRVAKVTRVESPGTKMVVSLKQEMQSVDAWQESLVTDVPRRWQVHGDVVLLPAASFQDPSWNVLGERLWDVVAKALSVQRVARQHSIQTDAYRSPQVQLLRGTHGWVEHVDNGIRYTFDITKNMFSKGNISEKLRIAQLDCTNQTVVDLYAGIGYFTLPYLVHAQAAIVYACEWNPNAIVALKKNLQLNDVADRCIVKEGDCREVCPTDVADHVNLGLLPNSQGGWKTACSALKKAAGGILHIHANVHVPHEVPLTESKLLDNEGTLYVDGQVTASATQEENTKNRRRRCWQQWADLARDTIEVLAEEVHGDRWNIHLTNVYFVKSYAPLVDHIVVDLDCRPLIKDDDSR